MHVKRLKSGEVNEHSCYCRKVVGFVSLQCINRSLTPLFPVSLQHMCCHFQQVEEMLCFAYNLTIICLVQLQTDRVSSVYIQICLRTQNCVYRGLKCA